MESTGATTEASAAAAPPDARAKTAGKKRGRHAVEEAAYSRRQEEREATLDALKVKYARQEPVSAIHKREKQAKKVKNGRLRRALQSDARAQAEAVESAARAEILLTEQQGFLEAEGDMEKTYKVRQSDVADMADLNVRAKMLDLRMEATGPYSLDWSRNGRHLLMGGRAGHLSVVDVLRNKPVCEAFVGETVRDVRFLYDHGMFAAAQKKHIFLYNGDGAEVHRLRSHVRPSRLEYLPYHYLLCSVGQGGWLKYQDVSTGDLVSEHRTKLGPCSTMTHNPTNAVVCLGHGNGLATLWSPSVSKPLVKLSCHGGPVRALAVSHGGTELVSAGLDGKLSVWDLRTYKRIHSYHTPQPPTSVALSQTGLLALACGYQVQVWKDALRVKQQSPYMTHQRPGETILEAAWRPFEDVLGLGMSCGMQTVVVPGAGFANYDAFEANPFETTKQRREGQVRKLLEKLQPGMIVLDPTAIGTVDATDKAVLTQERKAEREEAAKERRGEVKEKHKMRGKGKIGKKLKNKHRNIVSEERDKMRSKLAAEAKDDKVKADDQLKDANPVFKRFAKSKYSDKS